MESTASGPSIGARSQPSRRASHAVIFAVFGVSLFFSAFLLFLIQPLFSKTILPLLGGAPLVWNTAMVFYQACLLGGYLYAHQLGSRLPVKQQAYIHSGLLILAFAFLPIGIAEGWYEPDMDQPFFWLIGLLAFSVGLPFFALSANAPLLQRWFSRSDHPHAKDPYFLYAISNAGSLIGLLSYPFLFEPNLKLADQSIFWSLGYVLLFPVILLSGLAACGRGGKALPRIADRKTAPVSWARRFKWISLAAIPSGLMLSVTTFITTDIVSVPLLWIIPLSLYLLTFILTFAKNPPLKQSRVLHLETGILVLAAITSFWTFPGAQIAFMSFILIVFFVIAMACHGELAKKRPHERHLTEFYVWMSLGGVLGGLFTALVAPVSFNAIMEYPILLLAAALLRPSLKLDRGKIKTSARRLVIPVSITVIGLALLGLYSETYIGMTANYLLLGLMAMAAILFLGQSRTLFTLLCFALILFSYFVSRENQGESLLGQSRSFFGVYKIKQQSDNGTIILSHGTTVHGVQLTAEGRTREPSAYYYKASGIGRALTALNNQANPPEQIGVVGLGIGSLACYRTAGQSWTFYEIDPLVVDIARDERHFHFLGDCTPDARIVVGDARLMLEKEPASGFDILILDAFSSDAIPLHLLTREAMALYFTKVADSGLVFVHISNRFFDLEPVLAANAEKLGVSARIFRFNPQFEDGPHHLIPSTWVALARSTQDFAPLLQGEDGENWKPLKTRPGIEAWSDDFSNIYQILK